MGKDNIVARKVDQIFLDYECDLEKKPAKKQEY